MSLFSGLHGDRFLHKMSGVAQQACHAPQDPQGRGVRRRARRFRVLRHRVPRRISRLSRHVRCRKVDSQKPHASFVAPELCPE